MCEYIPIFAAPEDWIGGGGTGVGWKDGIINPYEGD